MNAGKQELQVTFTASVVKKDAAANVRERGEAGVFGVQEIDIGGEDFVVVFARTHVEPKKAHIDPER